MFVDVVVVNDGFLSSALLLLLELEEVESLADRSTCSFLLRVCFLTGLTGILAWIPISRVTGLSSDDAACWFSIIRLIDVSSMYFSINDTLFLMLAFSSSKRAMFGSDGFLLLFCYCKSEKGKS